MAEQGDIPQTGAEKYRILDRLDLSTALFNPRMTQGFEAVYIRTDSGNIYRLDRSGRLINAIESRKTGKLQGLQFEPGSWASSVIEVGKSFHFPNGGHTTTVTEVIAVTGKSWGGEEPGNSIIKEFKSGLPHIPSISLEGEFEI